MEQGQGACSKQPLLRWVGLVATNAGKDYVRSSPPLLVTIVVFTVLLRT